MSARRYPLEPLRAAVGASSINAMLRRLGVSGSTEQDYRRNGVTEKVADRLAVKAGFNPYEVWPEMADHLVEDAEVTCARDDCPNRFVPLHHLQKYCRTACGRVVAKRRYRARLRATDPAWVEAQRAARRERYEQERDYELAQQARRDAARRRPTNDTEVAA